MDSIIIVALGFFLILIFLLYYKFRYPFVKQMNEIAGPDGWPFVGTVKLFYSYARHNGQAQFQELFLQYGPVFRTWVGHECLIHIGGPEHAQIILSSSVNIRKSRQYAFTRPFLGNSLGAIKTEQWFQWRNMLTPAFHAIVLGRFFDTIVKNCEIFLQRLEERPNADEFDIFPYVTDLSIDIIAETCFNVKMNVQKGLCADYVKNIENFSTLTFKRMMNPFIYPNFIYALTQDYQKCKKWIKELHKTSMSIVLQRIADRKKDNSFSESIADESEDSNRKKYKPYLDTMLDTSDEFNNALTLKEINEEVGLLLFAGYDPVATTISMAIYLIGLHPEIQDNIHAELDSILPFEDSLLNAETLGKLKYLESTIKETLRLYAPLPVIARCLIEPVVLDKHTIPAGTNVAIHTQAIHRSPHIYPNPDKFDPSNFYPEREKNRHPFAFFPFSAGPRNCIGQKLARMEIKIALATFFKKYEVKSLTPLEEMTIYIELAIKPAKGVIVKLKRRKL